ncbi:CsbD family protein [Streptomyces sp. NPDC046261]|uniref:CsbD family protein n=1 Tax=Streptomyces sp. NPDC046261 TaxID=3157200 RepID=UPI0033D09C15
MSAKDKAKAKAERAKGQIKETTGKAAGDRRMEAEGRAAKAKGEVREAVEKGKDALKRKRGGH